MDITLTIKKTVLGIPPRCRKYRPIEVDPYDIVVTIPEVTSADAPVAIRADGTDYRWHEGRLWTQQMRTYVGRPDEAIRIGDAELTHTRTLEMHLPADAEVDAAVKEVADHLIVDGLLWEEAAEPVYTYVTLGLDLQPAGSISSSRYLRWDRAWAAHDRAAFIASMRSCLERNSRADDPRLAERMRYVESTPTIDVLIEEAAAYETPSLYRQFAMRWPSTLDVLHSVLRDEVGVLPEDAAQRLASDVLDYLVPSMGEWAIVDAFTLTRNWTGDADQMRGIDEARLALTRLGMTRTGAQRSIVQVEVLHDEDVDAVRELVATLAAKRNMRAFVVTAHTENAAVTPGDDLAVDMAERQTAVLAGRP